MKKSHLLLAFSVLIFTSCSNKEIKVYNSVNDKLTDAKSTVTFVSVEEFREVLETGSNFYLIDCREEEEFQKSCIRGAENVARGLIEFNISEKAPKKRNTIYLYCDNGDRSTLVAAELPLLKYTDIKVIEGGFEKWSKEYVELVELNPIRGNVVTKAPAKPSGGCGG